MKIPTSLTFSKKQNFTCLMKKKRRSFLVPIFPRLFHIFSLWQSSKGTFLEAYSSKNQDLRRDSRSVSRFRGKVPYHGQSTAAPPRHTLLTLMLCLSHRVFMHLGMETHDTEWASRPPSKSSSFSMRSSCEGAPLERWETDFNRKVVHKTLPIQN